MVLSANASSLDSRISAAPQPLASLSDYSRMLEDVCGDIKWSDTAPISTRTEFATATCDGQYLSDPGRFTIRLLEADDNGTRELRTSIDDRDRINGSDLDVLVSLGFDLAELGYSFTRDIVVEDRDDESGVSHRSYLGTLTVVERSFGDYWVPGSRLTVTRDAKGEILEIGGTWPELDLYTDFRDADEPRSIEEYASLLDVDIDSMIDVRAALEPYAITEAHVLSARTVSYVTWRVQGPEGSTAAIGVYFEGATPLWGREE